MDVFLMVRRKKCTIFTDAKENTSVMELKKMVEGILKYAPDDQRLYKDDTILDETKTLAECGFTSQTARAQAPATVGLAVRDGEIWETLDVQSYSTPPELPDVMKPQEASTASHPAELEKS